MDDIGIKFAIMDTYTNMKVRLEQHNQVVVGVSGGSDSNIIVHMLATYFTEYLPKIHFVFENTGLEYKATLRHLDYMEKRYGISIDRVRGESVVSVCRKYGVPIVSKEFSQVVEGVFAGRPSSIKRLNRTREESKFALPKKQKALAQYLLDNEIKTSARCCDLSKKKPHKLYLKSVNADLTITGERQCEGGQRATRHKGCFSKGVNGNIDKYMPLFYWDDETKDYYKETEGIVYSDCYEVWGMSRTGCVGCPFNSKVGDDLLKIKEYEPGLYKACLNVFGNSYQLMDEYNIHKVKILNRGDDNG